jgi:hypothetical protein
MPRRLCTGIIVASKPFPMYRSKGQEEYHKYKAAKVARSASASAQAGKDGRVQRGIQKEVRDGKDDLTRRAGLRDEKVTVYRESEDSSPASGACRCDVRRVWNASRRKCPRASRRRCTTRHVMFQCGATLMEPPRHIHPRRLRYEIRWKTLRVYH